MALWLDDEVRARVELLELDWNRFGVDSFGVGKRELGFFYTLLGHLYRRYFDVAVHGIDNIPPRGRAMLVGNHSGGLALDGAMVFTSVFLEMQPPRLAHAMAEKFIERLPFASRYAGRLGHLTGLPEHALRLLEADRLLMVFPEGARGTAKLYGDRNSLVGFGSGFMRLALQTKTPIIPFAFLGGGDAIPTVLNLYRLGRLIGMPYLPITPYLVPLPRPVDLQIYYSEPLRFAGDGNEDDVVINEWVDEVKTRIASLIDEGVRVRQGGGEASFR